MSGLNGCAALVLLLAASITAAQPELFLVAQPSEANTVLISTRTRECQKLSGEAVCCDQLGVNSVFGLKKHSTDITIQEAIDILHQHQPCLYHGADSLLLLGSTAEQEQEGVWTSLQSLHKDSKHQSWYALGIVRRQWSKLGWTYTPVQAKHLCSTQAAATTASQRRRLQQSTANSAGVIVGWGDNTRQIPVYPPTIAVAEGVIQAIAPGGFHVAALLKNKTVIAWGSPSRQNRTVVPDIAKQGPIKQVESGMYHSLALTEAGEVIHWGSRGPQRQWSPPPETSTGVTKIRAVWQTSFAQLPDSTWVSWGEQAQAWNNSGFATRTDVVDIGLERESAVGVLALLANGTVLQNNGSISPPSTLPTVNATALCCSEGFAVVLDANGTALTWGKPEFTPFFTVPANIQGNIVQVACGASHVVVQLKDGSCAAFGDFMARTAQVPTDLPDGVTAIGAGDSYSLFLLQNGDIMQGGWLPDGDNNRDFVPATNDLFTKLAVGEWANVAIKQSGGVIGWGYLRTQIDQVPQDLASTPVTAVSVGQRHALALTTTGRVVQWGGIENAPVVVEALSGVSAVAAGGFYSLAIKQGKVLAWGDPDKAVPGYYCNVTTVPDALTSNVTALSAANTYAVALKQDGSVYVWGCNDNDTMEIFNVPKEAQSGIVQIAAGDKFALALTNQGKVIAWGSKDVNITDIPANITSRVVTSIEAGKGTALAMFDDRTVVAWGVDAHEVPADIQGRIKSIGLGGDTFAAIVDPPVQQPTPAVQAASSGGSKKLPTGGIVGVAVGGTVLLAAVAGIAARMYWLRTSHRRAPVPLSPKDPIVPDYAKNAAIADIPGLVKGEAFTRSTAHEYSWTAEEADYVTVTPGGNDAELDKLAVNGQSGPAVQLTKQEVQEQVELLRNGLLGRGATALVFKCRWPKRFGPNAVLAAKVLKEGYELDVQVLQAFCYEASVLAGLNHPNIVRLYGYCLEPPTVCLILELLPFSLKDILYRQPSGGLNTGTASGYSKQNPQAIISAMNKAEMMPRAGSETLETDGTVNIVVKDPPATSSTAVGDTNMSITDMLSSPKNTSGLTMQTVLEISIDIAAGLKYLHDMPVSVVDIPEDEESLETVPETPMSFGNMSTAIKKTMRVVHRDLKPANILISPDGRAKISDFGLARQQMRSTMQTEHLAAGTLPYMAPELLVSNEVKSARLAATHRVDIYSMAMIMWEMLATRAPWSHMSMASLVAAVLGGRRPELPGGSSGDNDTTDNPPVPLSMMPASLEALPEYNEIIRACWQQREHRRPSPPALYDMLMALFEKYKDAALLSDQATGTA